MSSADVGVYTAEVRNSALPALVLIRRPIDLRMGCSADFEAVIYSDDTDLYCASSSINSLLRTNEGENLRYEWFKDGESIAQSNTSSFMATEAGVYFVEITDENLCTVRSEDFEIAREPDAAISVTADVDLLSFATEAEVVGQQWLLNGEEISGALNSTYRAIRVGWYSVRVTTAAACSYVSDSVWIDQITGLPSDFESYGFKLYPNPTENIVTIEAMNILEAKVYDLSGRLLQTHVPQNQNSQLHLSLGAYPPGTYFIHLTTERGYAVGKVVKE
jgi:hypothetical protein